MHMHGKLRMRGELYELQYYVGDMKKKKIIYTYIIEYIKTIENSKKKLQTKTAKRKKNYAISLENITGR